MTEPLIMLRPLEVLKASVEPKKMEVFYVPRASADNITKKDDTEDKENENDNPAVLSDTNVPYLSHMVSNVTQSYKEFDRNLVLERLKKNNMLTTYCNANLSPMKPLTPDPESIDAFVEETEDRLDEAEEEEGKGTDKVSEDTDGLLPKSRKRPQQRVQFDQTDTPLPEPPLQPVDMPEEEPFTANMFKPTYDNDQKPTTFVVCPYSDKPAKPGKAAGEQLAPERSPADFLPLDQISNWRYQLCNDFERTFELEGQKWQHVDHYMAYAQYKSQDIASSLYQWDNVAKVLKNKKIKPDEDFDTRKHTEMYHALYAKFSQHSDLLRTLYHTKNAKLLMRVNKQRKDDFIELMWLRETFHKYNHYLDQSAQKQGELVVPPVAKKRGKKTDGKSPDLRRVNIGSLEVQLPPPDKRIVRASSYYFNNRAQFVKRVNEVFARYRKDIAVDDDAESGDPDKFSLLTHQKVARDYINLYTPYRGVLLYFGLGTGKTCTSIAIAEGMKEKARQIFIMTPASLHSNYFEELQKCGDELYKRKQHWEFVSIEGREDMVNRLAKALTLSTRYIHQKKGAWMIDARKPSNYDNLSPESKVSLQDQLQQMIQRKYKSIHYNAPNLKSIIQDLETEGKSKNPFDHSVVIVDEAHNLVSRIVGKLRHKSLHTSIYYKLYDLLMSAENCRLVMLSGTPIINSPHELAVMFNMIRGYINTWSLALEKKTSDRINSDTLMQMLDSNGLKNFDFVNITKDNVLTITRNPFGFVNTSTKGRPAQVKRKYTRKNVQSPQENLPPQENQAPQDGGSGSEVLYDGMKLNESGNMDNDTFLKKLIHILNANGLPLKAGAKPKLSREKCLIDDKDKFQETFLKDVTNVAGKQAEESDLLHVNTLRNRIMGLTSYFRSAKEDLLPSFVMNEYNDPYHEVVVEMSDYQFTEYAKYRKEERDQEDKNKKAQRAHRTQVNTDELFEASSTFRIFSRACCNFAFPNPPSRPRPTKAKKADDEDKEDEDTLDEQDFEGSVTPMEQDNEVTKGDDEAYQLRIQKAMEHLEKNAATLLSRTGLQTYSPKFLEILNRIENPNHRGCHLLYSNFRTMEGIGILKLILEANGMCEFRIVKADGKWILPEVPPEDEDKPAFVLYTGTEEEEQKEIVRHVYNGTWEHIEGGSWKNDPRQMVQQLRAKHKNNMYGSVIKLFMITSAGAEGINLLNTRYVHVVEPYWHNVRLEQVVGRARRIKSHMSLPVEMRNVEVFVYLSTLSDNQRKDDRYKELLLNDVSHENQERTVSTDEHLYEVAQIKQKINKQFLRVLKETAMDCHLYVTKHNKQEDKPLVCYNSPHIHSNQFSSYPTLQQDLDEEPQEIVRPVVPAVAKQNKTTKQRNPPAGKKRTTRKKSP